MRRLRWFNFLLHERERSAFLRYGIVVLSVGLSFSAALWLRPFTYRMPYLLFSAAILISLLYGGRRAAIVCTILSGFLAKYFFIPPYGHFSFDLTSLAGVIYFCIFFWFICWLIDSRWERIEGARRESEERVQLFIEHAPAALAMFDREMRYLCASRRWRTDYGLGDRDLTGVSHYEVFPEISERWKEAHRRALAGEVLREENDRFERADGSVQWIRWEIRPWRDSTGMISGIVIFADDVTERKRAADARERLAAVVESSDDAIIAKTLDGTITAWNSGAEKVFGYSAAEAVGKPILMLVPPERAHEESEILASILRGESMEHLETVRIRKDGRTIEVSATFSPIRDSSGAIVGASKIARDVTERRRAQDDLRKSEDRYRDLVENSQDLICTHDLSGKMLSANPASARILGYSVAELLAIPMRDIIVPEFRGQFHQYLERIRKHGSDKGVLTVLTRTGERRIWEYENTLRTEGVETPIVRGMARDVTEKVRAEVALKESERQFHALGDSISQLAWMANPDGSIYWYNQRWYQYTGTTLEQMQGWGWQSVHDPVELPKVMEKWQASIASGESFDMVFPLRGADGVFRPFLTKIMPFKNAERRVRRWFGTNTDISEQKRIEDALRQSEARLNQAQHNAHIGSWLYRPDGTFVVSDEMRELYKLPRDAQVTVESLVAALHPEDRARAAAYFQKQLESDALDFFQDEDRVLWPDGQVRNTISLGTIRRDADGRVIEVVGTTQDVTEHKQAEAALRESEAKFRILADLVPQMVWMCTPDGLSIYFNQRWVDYTGLSLEESCGRGWDTPFHDDDKQAAWNAWNHAVSTGDPYTVEARLRAADGRYRWFLMQGTPSRDASGTVIKWFGTCTDIEDMKQAEIRLREYERVVEGLDEKILVLDREYRYVIANPAFLKYRDIEREQIIGHTVPEIMGEEYFEAVFRSRMDECFRGEVVHYEFTYEYPNIGARDISASYFPIEGSEGIDRIAIVLQDITERKVGEAALRESEEKFRTLADLVPQMIWISTPDGLNTYCNRRWVDYTGLSLEETRGKEWSKPYHDDDKEVAWGAWRQAVATGRRYQVKSRLRGTDGRYRWFLMQVEPLRDASGTAVKWFGSCTDIEDIKQAEEAVLESQQRLAGIIASAMDAIITVDEEQRMVLFNAAAEMMFRCREAEVLGQSIERFIPQRFGAGHSEHIRKFGEDGVSKRAMGALGPLSAVRADGEEFEMEASISKVEVGDKKLFTVIMRDITARKQAEARLQEYERVVENLEEMILVVDRDYRYVLANRAFLSFRGLSAGQIVGQTVEEVVGTDAFKLLVRDKMAECFTGKVVQYEMTYDVHNLGRRDLFVSYYPIENPVRIEHIACVLQDITHRKLAEEALYKSEERFSKAFRNNPLAITLSTQDEGRYLDVNEAFLDMLGYKRQEVIGRTAREINFWGEPSDRVAFLEKLKGTDRVAKHHTQFRTAKGVIREAEIWAEHIELDGQRCILGITRDVTEIQQLEAQFRQAQKMEAVGRLAGGVAHDFNNIIGIVMGYCDISLDMIPSENPVNRYLLETKKAAQRAAMLTRQLLAFSRQQLIFPKVLNLNDVVQNVATMFLRLVGEDIEIEFRPGKPIGNIKIDPSQVEQILMNLVVNARDAMPTGGKIIIETALGELDEQYVFHHPGAHAGKYVVLTVSDTGCGMDETTESQIFDPFFTTKAAGKGTGLGLSTVYGIVKQSEGYILVYSELGKGTTFKIYFPRVREKVDELASSPPEADPPRGSETIVVVEDDKNLRKITTMLLQESGYRVVEAKDADEAMKIMGASEPEIHLILTDVVMPGKGGVELVNEARVRHPHLPALFMSGYTSDMVALREVLTHESSFLEKPFTKKALLTNVYAILHGNSMGNVEITK